MLCALYVSQKKKKKTFPFLIFHFFSILPNWLCLNFHQQLTGNYLLLWEASFVHKKFTFNLYIKYEMYKVQEEEEDTVAERVQLK